MEFKDLPLEVQIIAAEALRKIIFDGLYMSEGPANLAPLVRKMFISLYCQDED